MEFLRCVDGPCAGVPIPAVEVTEAVTLLLDGELRYFADEGEPAGVAYYRLENRDGGTVYVFMHVDTSEPIVSQARKAVNHFRKQQAARRFYDSPDYDAYTLAPRDDHPQHLIQHQHRKAHVDERMADLIVELWKRGWETAGSCQELRAGTPLAGTAYVDFWFVEHGQAFVDCITRCGIRSTSVPVTHTLSRVTPGGKQQQVTLDKINVHFAPGDIGRIVSSLQNSTPA